MAANPGGARVWFITGCSSDFGRELAGLVLRRGGRAILAGADPAALVDLVSSYPTAARALPLDAADESRVAETVAMAERAFGGVDVVVNIAETPESALLVTRAALPGMCERGSGHVVNIGATADGSIEALAAEVAPFGVKIAAVVPSVEAVIRLVEAPGAPIVLVGGRGDPERLRRILARLSPEADPRRAAVSVGANDGDPEALPRAGRAAE